MSMIPRSVLFYWSKGAEIRRNIIRFIRTRNLKDEPCFLNMIAKEVYLSHVAVKKHIDLLISEGYIKPINPDGKPIYLELTPVGRQEYDEIFNHGSKTVKGKNHPAKKS